MPRESLCSHQDKNRPLGGFYFGATGTLNPSKPRSGVGSKTSRRDKRILLFTFPFYINTILNKSNGLFTARDLVFTKRKETKMKIKNLLGLSGALLVAVTLCGCEEIPFECNQETADQAAALINEAYPNLHNSIKLKNAELVKSTPDHLYCRAKANVAFDYVSYELQKTEDGIFISTNPLADELNEAFKEIDDAINSMDFDF